MSTPGAHLYTCGGNSKIDSGKLVRLWYEVYNLLFFPAYKYGILKHNAPRYALRQPSFLEDPALEIDPAVKRYNIEVCL